MSTLAKPCVSLRRLDDELYEALREFCGADYAVGATESVLSVLKRLGLLREVSSDE